MKTEPRVLTSRQNHAKTRRQPGQKRLEPCRRVGRVKLVEIIDHEHSRLLEQFKIGEELVDHRLPAEARCRVNMLNHVCRSRERVDHRQPEALRIPLTPPDRHPRQSILEARRLHP